MIDLSWSDCVTTYRVRMDSTPNSFCNKVSMIESRKMNVHLVYILQITQLVLVDRALKNEL